MFLFVLLTLSVVLVVSNATPNYAFLSIGDWGGAQISAQDSSNVYAVSAQMGVTSLATDAKFIINTGDNFYWCGIQNTTDPQIAVDFEDPYTSLGLKWYNALGNHEYGYSVQAQIDYMKLNPLWIMPNRYYTQRIDMGGSNFMTMLFIDTRYNLVYHF
jgi:hypothetical protein